MQVRLMLVPSFSHRHGILMTLDGVISGGEGTADDLSTPGLEGIGFLLPRAYLCVSAHRQV